MIRQHRQLAAWSNEAKRLALGEPTVDARAADWIDRDRSHAKRHGMKVEVFVDLICPRCYLALPRLNDALAMFEHGDEVQIVYRSSRSTPCADARSTRSLWRTSCATTG